MYIKAVNRLVPLFMLSALLLGMIGCSQSSDSSVSEAPIPEQPSTPDAAVSPSPTAPSAQTEADSTLISPEGIGVAKLGMTLGELKQAMGSDAEFTERSPFMVDFDAIAVSQDGEVQFYILQLVGQSLTDDDIIQGLQTDNAAFQTIAGVGPGTPLAEAESEYGSATLSYHTQNESREYVRFEDQPASNMAFSTGNAAQSAAGIYNSTEGEYHETQTYQEGATIQSVLVICTTDSCTGAE